MVVTTAFAVASDTRCCCGDRTASLPGSRLIRARRRRQQEVGINSMVVVVIVSDVKEIDARNGQTVAVDELQPPVTRRQEAA